MEHDYAEVSAPVRYAVTEGWEGPVVAGPYLTYDNAILARRTLVRPWRMFWRRMPYVVHASRPRGQNLAGGGGRVALIAVEVDDTHLAFIRQQARLTDLQPRVRLDFEHFMALIPGRVLGELDDRTGTIIEDGEEGIYKLYSLGG